MKPLAVLLLVSIVYATDSGNILNNTRKRMEALTLQVVRDDNSEPPSRSMIEAQEGEGHRERVDEDAVSAKIRSKFGSGQSMLFTKILARKLLESKMREKERTLRGNHNLESLTEDATKNILETNGVEVKQANERKDHVVNTQKSLRETHDNEDVVVSGKSSFELGRALNQLQESPSNLNLIDLIRPPIGNRKDESNFDILDMLNPPADHLQKGTFNYGVLDMSDVKPQYLGGYRNYKDLSNPNLLDQGDLRSGEYDNRQSHSNVYVLDVTKTDTPGGNKNREGHGSYYVLDLSDAQTNNREGHRNHKGHAHLKGHINREGHIDREGHKDIEGHVEHEGHMSREGHANVIEVNEEHTIYREGNGNGSRIIEHPEEYLYREVLSNQEHQNDGDREDLRNQRDQSNQDNSGGENHKGHKHPNVDDLIYKNNILAVRNSNQFSSLNNLYNTLSASEYLKRYLASSLLNQNNVIPYPALGQTSYYATHVQKPLLASLQYPYREDGYDAYFRARGNRGYNKKYNQYYFSPPTTDSREWFKKQTVNENESHEKQDFRDPSSDDVTYSRASYENRDLAETTNSKYFKKDPMQYRGAVHKINIKINPRSSNHPSRSHKTKESSQIITE